MGCRDILAFLFIVGLVSSTTTQLNSSNSGLLADTFVDSSNANTNYGTLNALYVSNQGTIEYAYTLWDLSVIGTSVTPTNASFCMYLGTGSSGTWQTSNTSLTNGSTAWTETNLRWNTQGSLLTGNTVQSSTSASAGSYRCWDVTYAVQQTYPRANKNMSLLTNQTTAGAYTLVFNSKENSTNFPYLNITYLNGTESTNGLVGYWKLDEGSDIYTNDWSGYGNYGTLVNSPTWTTGKNYQTPYALQFSSGSSQYVSITPSTSLQIPANTGVTISAWYKGTTTPNSPIFFKTYSGDYYGFWVLSSGNIYFETNTINLQTLGVNVSNGNWHHIAGIRNDTGYLKLYVDGVLLNTSATTDTTALANGASSAYIGTNLANYVDATIDEVKVWNRTLSDAEIWNETWHYCKLGSGSFIATYNESASSYQAIGFSLTASNTTSSFSYSFPNPSTYFTDYYCNSSFPIGSTTISISNSTSFYSPRYYYATITTGTAYGLNAYLLPLSDTYAISTTFYVVSNTGTQISGANVTVKRNYGSGYVTIAQGQTDTLGGVNFKLDSTIQYQITFNADGYSTYTLYLTPTQAVYTVNLGSQSSSNIAVGNVLANMSFNVTPYNRVIMSNQSLFTINYSVWSNDSKLEWYGMNVSYNGALQYTVNQTSSTGGSVNYTFNVSVLTTNNSVVVYFWFKKTGFDMFIDPITYTSSFYNESGLFSLKTILSNIKSVHTGGNSFVLGLIAIVITVLIAGYVSAYVNIGVGGFVALAVLTFFSSWNFFGDNSASVISALWLLAIGWWIIRYT